MKKAISLLLAVVMVIALFPVFDIQADALPHKGIFVCFNTMGEDPDYDTDVFYYVKDAGQAIKAPFPPKSENYEFAGWYKDPDCKYAWDFSKSIISNVGFGNLPSQITLFAKWVEKTEYSIKNITDKKHNFGEADLAKNTDLSVFFTWKELASIESGKNASVWLNVKEDKTLSSKYDVRLAKNVSIKFLTVEMFKCIGKFSPKSVKEITEIPSGDKVTVALTLPKDFYYGKNTCTVLHFLKNGSYEILDSKYNKKTGALSFETDSFSNFAIVNAEVCNYADYNKISVEAKNVKVDVPAFAKAGDTVSFTVTPDKDYKLDKLYIWMDGTVKAVDYVDHYFGEFTFVMPKSNVTICAVGAEIEYPIHVNAEKANVYIGYSAMPGAEAKFTVAPFEGYELDKLTITTASGKNVTYKDLGNGIFSFVMPKEKVEIKVVCKEKKAVVTLPFVDVDKTSDIYDAVCFVYEKGLMVGVDAYTFGADEAITRAMIVTILWRLEGCPELIGASKFTDVTPGSYYAKAVAWAEAKGIVLGYDDGTFAPGMNITRDQLACILYRYAQYKGEGFTGAWMYLLPFEDRDKVRDWAYESIAWCYMKGLMKERTEGMFAPKETATRGDTAVALTALCEALDK